MNLTLKDLVKHEFSEIESKRLLDGNWKERAELLQKLAPGEYAFIPMSNVVAAINDAKQKLRDGGLNLDIDDSVSNVYGVVGIYLGKVCPMERILMVYKRR